MFSPPSRNRNVQKPPAPLPLATPKPLVTPTALIASKAELPVALRSPAPLRPAYRREPAITKEAVMESSARQAIHPHHVCYRIMDSKPWPLGFLFWITDRRSEAGNRDLLDYLIEYINRTPSK